MEGQLLEQYNYFIENQEQLAKEYAGKAIVIHDKKVVGVFDSEFVAARHALQKYEEGTFLVQVALPGPEVHTIFIHSGEILGSQVTWRRA